MCAYTSHGHCGILKEDGSIDNAKSIKRLAEQATSYAKAGRVYIYIIFMYGIPVMSDCKIL